MLTFIAELNGQQVWATDIGNAYLELYTKEKVYIKLKREAQVHVRLPCSPELRASRQDR